MDVLYHSKNLYTIHLTPDDAICVQAFADRFGLTVEAVLHIFATGIGAYVIKVLTEQMSDKT